MKKEITLAEEMTTADGRVLKAGTIVTRDLAKELGLLGKKNAQPKKAKTKSLSNESKD